MIFKIASTGRFALLFHMICGLCTTIWAHNSSSSVKSVKNLLSDSHYEHLMEFSNHLMNHRYELANQNLQKLPDSLSLLQKLFNSLSHLGRFDDFKDYSDLYKAKMLLKGVVDGCEERSNSNLSWQFWCGLAQLQLGFAISEESGFKGLLKVRSGANLLQKLPLVEAQGFAAVYHYYAAAPMAVFGLKKSQDKQVKHLHKAYKEGELFKGLLGVSVGWTHYDRQQFAQTQRVAQQFLQQYPGNRIYQQMLGDALRSQKKWDQGWEVYTQSEKTYHQLAPGSVRHISAVGNLVLIAVGGMEASEPNSQNHKLWSKRLKTQKSAFFKSMKAFEKLNQPKASLPSSLIKELKRKGIF